MRIVGAVIALIVLAIVVQSVAFNPRWEWRVFARWFFDPVILEGLGQTLLLTLISGYGIKRYLWRRAGAGAVVQLLAIEQPGVELYLAVSFTAADCGTDYSLQLLISMTR